ncbi:hypothetical protein FHL15_000729 [Xylaria flabelliformis]|uniref:Uncharacterized protein n=1 Tax=Xylaria flabelliformis TaxID=2512241 RepID=A0A553IEL5_9PEZI|nr:hypothetical protein FHL15_000729 [Xylaria flabelliformis]
MYPDTTGSSAGGLVQVWGLCFAERSGSRPQARQLSPVKICNHSPGTMERICCRITVYDKRTTPVVALMAESQYLALHLPEDPKKPLINGTKCHVVCGIIACLGHTYLTESHRFTHCKVLPLFSAADLSMMFSCWADEKRNFHRPCSYVDDVGSRTFATLTDIRPTLARIRLVPAKMTDRKHRPPPPKKAPVLILITPVLLDVMG